MLSFPHSLASNNLVETGYVKKSKVQGASFEVGAKVTYEGRETTVSMAPDSDGDIKMYDLSGVMALAACLPECRSLTSLKCAAAAPTDCSCQRPLTRSLSPSPSSHLAVSTTTASETRVPPHSLPSSRRQVSPKSGAPPPPSVRLRVSPP